MNEKYAAEPTVTPAASHGSDARHCPRGMQRTSIATPPAAKTINIVINGSAGRPAASAVLYSSTLAPSGAGLCMAKRKIKRPARAGNVIDRNAAAMPMATAGGDGPRRRTVTKAIQRSRSEAKGPAI